MGAGAAAVSPPGSVASETSLGGGQLSPDRSLSPGPERRASGGVSGSALHHSKSAGALGPEQSGARAGLVCMPSLALCQPAWARRQWLPICC